jgi:signal transduction histidine kinase
MWGSVEKTDAKGEASASSGYPFARPGARGPRLARQLIVAFLVVTLPGTLALGALTLISLRSVGDVNRQLSDITHSLIATQDVHLTIARAEEALGEHIIRGDAASRREFERLVGVAEQRTLSCESSECHGASRTPFEMARLLRASFHKLRTESGVLFVNLRPGHGTFDHARMETVRALISDVDRSMQRMSSGLLVRVEDLGGEAEQVRRRASWMIGSTTLVVTLAACGAAILVAGRLSRPLRELLLGTRRVMAGDWNNRVTTRDSGEIGELALSFNAMVENLTRYRERVEDYSRTLEERVRERTEELERKERALRQSERLASLGQLAAGVAHELNNPLTSIVMNANLLIEEVGPDSPLYDDLQKIDADAARCRRIIEDLHVFARRRELVMVHAGVEGVVDRAFDSVAAELRSRGIQWEADVSHELPDVWWDPDRIVEALANVMANGAQAMGAGGRLTVVGRREDGWLRLEVRDSGPGIPAEHRPRIFDPFFTTKPDGTGLGLSIAHGIVNEHGGRIEVETRTREDGDGETGTTVRIILPIAEAPS